MKGIYLWMQVQNLKAGSVNSPLYDTPFLLSVNDQ